MTKMSDVAVPSLLITEGTEPSAPAAGKQRLYIDSTSHHLTRTDSSGTEVDIEVAGAGLTDPMTTRGDIIIRNSSNVSARLAIGSSGKVLSSDGTDVSWQTPSSFSLLAVKRYQPGTDSTIYTATTTPALADATNLVVTFTAPASGNVLVKFTGVPNLASSSADQYWALWEGGALIGTHTQKVGSNSVFHAVTAPFYLTGVSAGSHTYQWAAYKVNSGTSLLSGGPLYGAALMEVWG